MLSSLPSNLSFLSTFHSEIEGGQDGIDEGPRFFSALAEHLPSRLPECLPQHLSNTLYAMAQLAFRHDAFLAAVCAYAPSRWPESTNQNLGNTCYALTQLCRPRHPPSGQSVREV